jgi:RimJ/RimL family protein N-acetyltransferase
MEVGYWLGRPFWGFGYMTEALSAAMAWAAGPWGRRWMVSGHFDDNPASGRVLIKAGFLPTGEIRWRFSLARGEAAPTRMMVWLA